VSRSLPPFGEIADVDAPADLALTAVLVQRKALHPLHHFVDRAFAYELPFAHGKARVRDVTIARRLRRRRGGYALHAGAAAGAVRHFIDVVAGHAGAIYGRRIYEVMRYWDVDRQEWDVAQREFAAAWRRQPKWIASRTLASVGPNATLIRGDLDAFVRDLKATVDGELDVAGPELAAAVAPLIDEYRLYFRPYVLGGGKPYFAGARPPLRLVATDRIGEDVVRLTYVPA
jgi:dihydrofolate reductase